MKKELFDNRSYDYTQVPNEYRAEYDRVVGLVKHGSTILDLGCGNGFLMELLRDTTNAECTGIDISPTGVSLCKEKGFRTFEGRIDETLPFQDNSFEYAVCNVTIQMVHYPDILLREMKRVAKILIISFPNFAFYKNRIELMLKGRMPKKLLFGYKWYDTGHIHQFSIKDFYELVEDVGGLQVIQHDKTETLLLKKILVKQLPNLFQILPVFLLRKLE